MIERNFLKKLGNLLGIKKKSRKYSYLKQIKNKEFYIMKKKLYKSVKDRKLTGVCGGIAEYFDIDSSIVRIVWLVLVLFAGTGLLAYIICAIVLDDNPNE